MMRFSRRRSSLSFPSSAVKTALNANHARAFLPHSAAPAHLRPQEVQMQHASKMDESWTDYTSIRLTDSLRSQVKGDAGKCGSLFFSNPIGVKLVCGSSCWSLSSVSCIIEMQQTPSSCTAFTSNELSLLELWMLFSFFFLKFCGCQVCIFENEWLKNYGALGKMKHSIFPQMNLISRWNQT